ncbi:MAG: helix-turn-helix domain containing protein [Candidatus Riflebacteria bacterium]|nr:helix-turn-helix domain containing protein [Candidatus Riflebacteria bacterium]
MNPSGYSYGHFVALFRAWQIEGGLKIHFLDKWRVNSLSEKAILELKKWRHSKDKRLWAKAVSILDCYSEFSLLSICKKIERSPRIVKRWISEFNEGGVSALFPKEKRQQCPIQIEKIKERRNRIINLLHESPHLHQINRASWSFEAISKAYQFCHQEKISRSTISECIRAEGYGFRKAKKVLTSPDPDFREKVNEISRILSNLKADEKFFSVDEFGPFTVKLQGGRSFTKIGTYRTFPQWQKSRGKLILTGALELSKNQITHFYSEINTNEMLKLLEILLDQYHDQSCLYLSWDAASWHISGALKDRVSVLNNFVETGQRKPPKIVLASSLLSPVS